MDNHEFDQQSANFTNDQAQQLSKMENIDLHLLKRNEKGELAQLVLLKRD